MADMSESFHIVIKRDASKGDLVPGHIYLNEELLGSTYERTQVKIPAGDYKGLLRYHSGHHFVQSAQGTMSSKGDFLIEASGVEGRTNILLHTGNKPKHSDGCICLGPIFSKDTPDGTIYSVGDDSPLRKLRLAFYGTDHPNATPDKAIVVSVVDAK
jgi:hypothetical protein